MYEEYFRLSDAPFRLNPDPRFFYGSRSHNKAMAYLHYGLKQAEGFIVITGPVGAGKSMLIGHLLDQLNASNVVAANLLTSNIEPEDLLAQILSAFRIEPEGEGRTGQIEAFEDYLFDQLNRGRRVLLIIDEAQNLPFKTLEELRMLSNLDYEGTPLFQVFLVGQPEFRSIMEQPNMEQLRQRVIASYHLENLSEEETRDYILHRLSVAGWREDPAFTEGAFHAIFEESTGLPRRINTLCNRLMLYCSLEEAHEVTAGIVETVCAELREEKLESRKAADPLPPVEKVEEKPARRTKKKVAAAQKPSSNAEHSEQPTPEAEAPQLSATDDTVVSIETTKKKTVAPQNPELREEKVEKKSGSDAGNTAANLPARASMSVLDRVRAKKVSAAERQEATLTDVASAIAAASEASANGPQADKESQASVIPTTSATPQWRDSVARSIEETREELKLANANVISVTRSVTDSASQCAERRRKISETLDRADLLLVELREAQG
ncbi:XrtA/PEP-CTERM system-associated ATPase [Hyphococcus sp.]|uniref:XrtA/PEP-CTERM system-associated ATPase n=1 Tax=Hyphococcus sp. TaxID=2038636 RepID=UPI002086F2ED|nr:MAG: hypothetical protein DHS20C04_11560 [Marinicaulis sp.]